MLFNYSFPAVKGKQANSTYYICMIPCKLLKILFKKTNEDTLPEFRAQRKLNENRIPEIRDYILKNRDSYVFSALAASIDGEFKFIESVNSLGVLEVDMSAIFLINDGQHRNAAIQEAILDDPTIGDETIPVVFFEDKGLRRSQQMFTDLNKYAVKPSKSQNTFYDHKDGLALVTKELLKNNDFLRDYTDVENDTLGKYSAKLFTLNCIYSANKYLIGNKVLDEGIEEFIYVYWNIVVDNIYEWQQLVKKEITKISLREDYIVTQNIILYALGKLGNFFLCNKEIDMKKYLCKLSKINWMRSNKDWIGNAIEDGKISKKSSNVTLTYNKIKELIGL